MSTHDLSPEQQVRKAARKRVERSRRLTLRVVTFSLGMLVLTPVWAVGEYLSSGGWPQRLSPNGNPGDWSPWIIWVALIWGFYVVLSVVVVHFDRPISEHEIEREVTRLAGRA